MHAVVNNTVLSNLAKVQRPDLLRVSFGNQVATTRSVLDELATSERLRRIPSCDWSRLVVVKLSDEERALADRLSQTLGAGEATCIAVAQNRRLIFLSDDRDARRLAQSLQIPTSGTLGVLQSLVDDGYLDSTVADKLLAEMIAKGYRSPVTSLKQLQR